jgi:hypothetical protein
MDITLWDVAWFASVAGVAFCGALLMRDVTIMKRQLARIDTKCFDPES